MKYLKDYRVWILSLILIYTLCGFVFVPWFLSNKVPSIVKEQVGANIEIGESKFNPYTFELSVKDIMLKDLDKKPVFKLKEISLEYSLNALLDKTILFEYLNISSPKLYAKFSKDGELNLKNIVVIQETKDKQTDKKEDSNIPTIVLKKLTITKGEIKFVDLKPKKPFSINLGPYSITAHNLSTKKGDINSHTFTAKIENDGLIHWEGGMELIPLSLHGTIDIENLQLSKIYDYVLPEINAKLNEATLNLKVPYKIDLEDDLQVHINKAKLSLSNIKFLNIKSNKKIIDIPKINLDEFNLEYPKQEVKIKSFNIDEPYIFASMDKEYKLNLVDAFVLNTKKQKEKSEPKKEETTQTKAWKFLLSDAKINQASITFEDNSLTQSVTSKLEKTSLHLTNISSNKKESISYKFTSILNKDSKLSANGSVIQEPLSVSSKLDIQNFHIRDYVNYIEPFVNFDIKKADVDLKASLQAQLEKEIDIKVKADTIVKDVHINDSQNKKLVLFNNLAINDINYIYNPMSLDIKNIKLTQPYIRALINKDGSTNFSNLTKDTKEIENSDVKKESTKKEKQTPIKIKIGPVDLVNGITDFSDLSIRSGFNTKIHDINAHLSALDFQSKAPSKVKLSAKIDRYGYTNIEGSLSPFDIKDKLVLDMLVKNIDLKSITPYSSEFIGNKIKSGKLSMDLRYNIKKAQLQGDNQLNIDSFELGDEVDSPNAVNLPIGLAVVLLKDSDDQINIDLPVSGDMNSPEFSYGGIVWGAFKNLLTKIVTSPFNFIGSILGIDADELKGIDFEKGSFTITSTEHEKLKTLQKIMKKRPKIKINIIGKYDEIYDVLTIQEKRFKVILDKELKKLALSKATQTDPYTAALRNLYSKQFSLQKYYQLKAKTLLETRKNKTKFNFEVFNKKVKNILVTSKKVPKGELIELANKRALSIKDVLVKEYKVQNSRIHIKTPQDVKAKRDRWIESDLEISM